MQINGSRWPESRVPTVMLASCPGLATLHTPTMGHHRQEYTIEALTAAGASLGPHLVRTSPENMVSRGPCVLFRT